MNPRWIELSVVLAVHEQQISEHGGLLGIRDLGTIESALARPQNLMLYNDPDIFDLAAAYGFGLARNHGFIDGNKRTAFVVYRLFLLRNGLTLSASKTERYLSMLQLAAGELSEDEFAKWLSENTVPIS